VLKPAFIYISYIETTPEALWEALTNSAFTTRYWWDTQVISDWKVGSPVSLVVKGKTTDVGEVLEAAPPRRLSYSFHHILNEAALKERPSRVTFVLEPFGRLVKLSLTHEGFAGDSVVHDGISKGWPAILSSLKSLLETGQPLDIPFDALEIAELDEAGRR
jgi:uncharacterized protein YndB with AHSA1/START domain